MTRSAGSEKSDLDPQPFAVEVVEHVQQPECPTVSQPVGHEVHLTRSCLGCIRHGQRIRLVALQPLAGLDPQVQLQLAVDPIDPLVVPCHGPLTLRRCRKHRPNPHVLRASVSPTSRSAISRSQAFSFGP
jgi:hypothetical protein